jgi:phosphoheptose isomerase
MSASDCALGAVRAADPAAAADLLPAYQAYFGMRSGGVDLRRTLAHLPLPGLQRLADRFTRHLHRRRLGRVFFFGNGGSHDNARSMAQRARCAGIPAQVPGHPDDYLSTALTHGYASIYRRALDLDEVGPHDAVIGISGSGNSENVIAALACARERGAEVWCLGGRDGGRMAALCGVETSLIAASDCMEAIEDAHHAMVMIALDAANRDVPAAIAADDHRRRFSSFLTPRNLLACARLGTAMLDSMLAGGRTLILGIGVGANHFRADLGRGASNAVPIRGFSAPDVFSMNSAQATANDDGIDFVLADGLVKCDPDRRDVAVLCALPGVEKMLAHVREIIASTGTPWITIGTGADADIDVAALGPDAGEPAIAMIGHASGVVLRSVLQRRWGARRLDHRAELPPGQKKLGVAGTMALEQGLRAGAAITSGEWIAFCYGELYAVTPPERAPARCWY